MAALVLLMCVVMLVVPAEGFYDPIVNTTSGQLRGVNQTLDGVDYFVFKGVPYAQPPVGPLRFSAPVANRWDGLFNATNFSLSCPQDISGVATYYPEYMVQIPAEAQNTSEDCLTLNIYTPVDVRNVTTDSSLAVVFFIHGGSSVTGQGSGYDPSGLVVRGGVVVVTINYRLNVFGFLGTGDDVAPGNFGLLDQQLALKWVHKNIAAFGGDPNRITLFGQSDGGIHVTLHMFANASRPLFKRVASHSGHTANVFLQPRSFLAELSFKIGREAGCDFQNTSKLIHCLRDKPMEEIFIAAKRLTSDITELPIFFLPVIDDVFISSTVDHQDLAHDLLILHTSGDGSVILEVAALDLFPDTVNYTKGVTEDQLHQIFTLLSPDNLRRIAITREYTDRTATDQDRMEAVVKFMLDLEWLDPFSRIIKNQQKLSSLRWSIFDYRSAVDKRYPGLTLSPHGEELPYVFGLPFSMTSHFTDEERYLSDRVIRYWSNFAKTGDPNVNPELNTTGQDGNLTYWPEYGESETYLLIQLNESTVGQGYRKEKVKFWTDYLPGLLAAAAESCPAEPGPTDKPDCKESFIGEGLGLKLTPQQAETLIQVFMFLIIALLVVLIMIFGAVMGYKVRYKENKTRMKEKDVVQQTNSKIKKAAAFEESEGFTTESENTNL